MKNRRRKRDLISQIQDRTDINKIAVERVVDAFMEEIISIVAEDGRLELRNFGIFDVVLRAERPANNPKTGERMLVPPRRVVRFKASKYFLERAKQNAAPNTFCESLEKC